MRKSEKSNSFPVPLGDLLMGARPACSEHGWAGRIGWCLRCLCVLPAFLSCIKNVLRLSSAAPLQTTHKVKA